MQAIGTAVLQGLSVLAACLGVFLFARNGHSTDAARALTFTTLVISFLVMILSNRSWSRSWISMLRVHNAALRWVLLGTCVFLAAVLTVPFAQELSHFAPLHASDLALSIGAGLVCVSWLEVVKSGGRWRKGFAA
jgi:P-type Ca2+ transporter type 2C